MAGRRNTAKEEQNAIVGHGASVLPSVVVDGYNLRIRDKDGFIGDRASKSAFQDILDDWRKRLKKHADDPLGDIPTEELSKKQIDAFMQDDDKMAAALVLSAVDDFAVELVKVLTRFLKEKSWKKTERVVVGGGLSETAVGELAIAKTMLLLRSQGIDLELRPIVHHPDEAGLIGAVHLMPAWMLKGHSAIIAVDIGGTNIRAGIVDMGLKKYPDFSKAKIWKSELWRHADDAPTRERAVKQLVEMIEGLLAKALKAKLDVAPLIGVACPGQIEADGSIATGGQNLPGNWESKGFNLSREIMKAIPL